MESFLICCLIESIFSFIFKRSNHFALCIYIFFLQKKTHISSINTKTLCTLINFKLEPWWLWTEKNFFFLYIHKFKNNLSLIKKKYLVFLMITHLKITNHIHYTIIAKLSSFFVVYTTKKQKINYLFYFLIIIIFFFL